LLPLGDLIFRDVVVYQSLQVGQDYDDVLLTSFVRKLLHYEVEQLERRHLSVHHQDPSAPPELPTSQGILHFMKVVFEEVKGLLVESYLAIAMVIGIDEDARGWPGKGDLDTGELLLHYDVFDHMLLKVLVKDSHIDFLGSKDVLASKVVGLLHLEGLDGAIGLVGDHRLEDVDPTGGEPLVTPVSKVEVGTEGGLVSDSIENFLHGSHEVDELSVLPLMPLKIEVETLYEGFLPYHVVELLEER